ncbi:ABC transporter family protein, partial [Vibrio parahaemolyticus AQ3810]
LQINVD